MKKTILIADDEANLRKLVHTTLEDPGCRILEAADGNAALDLAKREKPDLVLVDWMMPGLTGIEVMKALRADPATATVPIIMLTAKGQEKDREQAVKAGTDFYLIKPFSPLELLKKVREVLESTPR